MLIIDMPMPKEKYVNVRIFADGTATVSTDEKPYFKEMSVGELVRCGECKYFIENTWECVRLSDRFGDEYSDARVYPEYYCADGERRSDD